MKKPVTLLIDGDIIAYKQAAGAEVATDWGDDVWSLHTDTRAAKESMDVNIRSLITALNADKVKVALSSKQNFRRLVDPSYKASRKTTRKPIGLPVLREHLLVEWRAVVVDELEADDLLGIWATDPMYEAGSKKIIVSTDKDMKTIPCKLWNPDHPEFGVKNISRKDADRFHIYQTLVGDTSDGYAGCPTYGPTRATRLLDSTKTGEVWERVVEAFEKQNLSKDDALVQARLARILRVENYNVRQKTIKHWTP